MDRLTFDGLFCDIAQCSDTPGGSFCEDGMCSQRATWERLKAYEDTGLSPEQVGELAKVVRCADCCRNSNGICRIMQLEMKPDDFCSYGKREEQNDA